MIDAADAVHVAGGYRMQRGEIARMAFRGKAIAECREHLVGAAEPTGGTHGDDVCVPDQLCGLLGGNQLVHVRLAVMRYWFRTAVRRPVWLASSTASAVASERTPSSPVAAGGPSPRIAPTKARSP